MGLGLPVVLSDISAFREVAGGVGVFVDRHDKKNIADTLSELVENDTKVELLSRKGKARVERKFDIRHCVDQHYDFYRKLLASGGNTECSTEQLSYD